MELISAETLRDLMCEAVKVDRTIDFLTGKIAEHLHGFAKKAKDLDAFLKACEAEEEWIKTADAGDLRIERLPKCWSQAKSDIKGAWKRGIKPTDHPTYSKLKQAKVALGKADEPKAAEPAKPADGKPGRAKNDPRNDKPTVDDDAVPPVTRDDALASGEVVYANATQIIPDYLLKTAKLLAAMPDTPFRAKAVKNVEAAAKMAHDMHFANSRSGNKQRGKQQAQAA